jgi:predicted phosphodiesterase
VKFCRVCGEPKDPSRFPRDRKNKDGRSNRCQSCNAAAWKRTAAARKRPAIRPVNDGHSRHHRASPIPAPAPANDPIPDPDLDLSQIPATAGRCATDVIVCDVHAPDAVDVRAWRCALKVIESLRPERVIILGDFGDQEAFSRHPGARPKDAAKEIRGCVAMLEEVRALHRGRLLFFEGNHEQWLSKWCMEHGQHLASMLVLEDLFEFKRLGITYVSERDQPYTLAPNLVAVHGHQLFGHMPPKYHAKTAILGYSTSLVYGHTHRPDFHQTERVPSGVIAAYGLGCLRELKPDWNKGPARSSSWAHGIGVVERDSAGMATVYSVGILEGRAVYGGREFQG